MGNKRKNKKNRKSAHNFMRIFHPVMDSSAYLSLSYPAVKLLNDICRQYNGINNGDLCVAWTLMKERGWKSRATLFRAIRELEKKGFVVLSRQGGRNKPNLYAVTQYSIDECKGKLDINATHTPSNDWKKYKP